MWHNQYQDTPGSYVSHLWDLQAENCDVQKRQTRRIPKNDEELQDKNQRDRKYKRIWEKNYPHNLIFWEALQEFNELARQFMGTENAHLTFIKEGLLAYFTPINALTK